MWTGKIEDYILYEDNAMIVCHKPAGLAVQNARIGAMDMESALKNYLAFTQTQGKMPYLGIVHRLDQPVEGVLVFAKTPQAAEKLSRQIADRTMEKIYLAVTYKKPDKEEGKLEDFLKKDGKTNTSSVTAAGVPGSKKSRLFYKVEEVVFDEQEGKEKYLLRIHLETGRHHQIRVQTAHAGFPLAGDLKYGTAGKTRVSLGLCAEALTFMHPSAKKKMQFRIKPEGEAFTGFSSI